MRIEKPGIDQVGPIGMVMTLYFFFFKDSIYLFLERGEGREKGRGTSTSERYIDWLLLACPQLETWPATQAHAQIGN